MDIKTSIENYNKLIFNYITDMTSILRQAGSSTRNICSYLSRWH